MNDNNWHFSDMTVHKSREELIAILERYKAKYFPDAQITLDDLNKHEMYEIIKHYRQKVLYNDHQKIDE